MEDNRRPLLKVLLVGDSGVGKTALYIRYIENRFSEKYQSTLGADFNSKEQEIADGRAVILQIWDTAGQERFQGLGPIFFRGADCLILVYDLTDRQSFEHLQSWQECFLQQANIENYKAFPIVCIGNKLDLDDRKILSEEVERAAWRQEFLKSYHFECSARDGRNVKEAFRKAASAACEYHFSTGEGPLLVPRAIYNCVSLDGTTFDPSEKKDTGDNQTPIGRTLSERERIAPPDCYC